jgi:hypothetical protein
VRASEACSICSDLGFEGHLRPDTQSQEGLYLKESFAKLVHRSMYCWFCRFLCRIVACDCRLKDFTRCVKENLPVMVVSDQGRWERNLLLSVDIAASAASFAVDIELLWPDGWLHLAYLRYHSVMTCHNLVSPPSKRLRKLFYDTVSQRKEFFSEVCRWISLCDSRHPICRRRIDLSLSYHNGFRVIDVNSRTLCKPTADCRYVALSYVWGEEPFSRAYTIDDAAPLLSNLIRQ